jgi:hypothetical protein
MEVNETLVVTFLVIVILILIFSKISIGSTTDESALIDQKIKAMENKIISNTAISSGSVTPTQSFDPRSNDLLSPEFKKQLDVIQDKFYYDNCRKNKL